jgi:hypothetical protein
MRMGTAPRSRAAETTIIGGLLFSGISFIVTGSVLIWGLAVELIVLGVILFVLAFMIAVD